MTATLLCMYAFFIFGEFLVSDVGLTKGGGLSLALL